MDMYLDHDDIKVSFHSGAGLIGVARKAMEIIEMHRPDTLLIMAGINDITVRNRYTGRVRLISTSANVIVSHMIQLINQAKSMILNTYPDIKVIFGGILGIDIGTYNRRHNISPIQTVVDDAITSLNAYIRQVNEDSGFPHPRLTSKVHTWRRGIKKNLYTRLTDGLHPGELVLQSWACHIRIMHDRIVELFFSQ